MIKKPIWILLCLVSFIASGNQADLKSILSPQQIEWLKNNKDSIRYAPNPSWPPGDFIDENGNHQGIVSDYIAIFEEQLNVHFKKELFKNWNGIYEGLLNDEVDFVGAIQSTENRRKYLTFTEPFLTVPLVILVKDDYPHTISDGQVETMKLAAVKGYSSQEYIYSRYKKANIQEYDDDLTALLQTSLGNTDGTIVDLMTASYLVQKYGIGNLTIGKELDFSWQLRFAVQKKYAPFAGILDSLLKEISEDERREIFNKWVNINNIPTPSFYKKYARQLLIGGIIFFIVFLLFLNYTIILKKEVRRRTKDLDRELEEKKKAIELLHKNEARLESLFEISKKTTGSVDELLTYMLDEAVKLTDSKLVALFNYNKGEDSLSLLSYRNIENDQEINSFLEKNYSLKDFGICSDIVSKNLPYQIDSCLTCKSEDTPRCPFGQFKLSHTLTVPVKDGEETEALLFLANRSTTYLPADAKQIVLLMSSVWKLMNKQRWQEELVAAKARAEESDKLKSAFLANLSHEIRTPMNSILGFTELLKDDNLLPGKKNNYIEIIHKSAHYLLSVIKDIIEISKIDSGLIKLNYSVFKLDELIADIRDHLMITIPEGKRMAIDLKFETSEAENRIRTDETKLRQVIENLLSNAFKFTDLGTIRFGYLFNDEKQLEFYVSDTGVGIEEKYHDVIFKRFRQGEETISIQRGGFGLGLAISKAYIEMMGGSIQLVSQPGKGSTFSFKVPVEIIPPAKQKSS